MALLLAALYVSPLTRGLYWGMKWAFTARFYRPSQPTTKECD